MWAGAVVGDGSGYAGDITARYFDVGQMWQARGGEAEKPCKAR